MTESFDDLIGSEDYKLPDQEIVDDEIVFGEGVYVGIFGKIIPFFAGVNGKKAAEDDPQKWLSNFQQEIWVKSFFDPTNPNGVQNRLQMENGSLLPVKKTARGIKLIESFPAPANPLSSKLAWKIKVFYSGFPFLFEGKPGSKVMKWERVKQLYGMEFAFEIKYVQSKTDSTKLYRNVVNIRPSAPPRRVDVIVMNRLELEYNRLRLEEKQAKSAVVPDDSIIDKIFDKTE